MLSFPLYWPESLLPRPSLFLLCVDDAALYDFVRDFPFAGMSISPTPNPLKHVLNAIGEDVEWLTYGACLLNRP